MASAASFPHLAPPTLEDSMEVSSPMGRALDEDIDIDYDDYDGGIQLQEDERMHEDTDQLRPGTANDEVMSDDHDVALHMDEEIMHDGPDAMLPMVDEDDELIDYDEDYQVPDTAGDVNTLIPERDLAQHMTDSSNQLHGAANPEADTSVANATPAQVGLQQSGHAQAIADIGHTTSHEFLGPHTVTHSEKQATSNAMNPELQPIEAQHTDPTAIDAASGSNDTNAYNPAVGVADSNEVDGRVTPTDTGLHPMIVKYGDFEFPLFKSQSQPDGLLRDDNLASVSLAELLQNCRPNLAAKIGEETSDAQDMVLRFDHMGLLIVEDSRSAFETSLNDVLEVFLHLHQNDETEEVPPLILTLSMQLKFSSSLGLLREAASQGRGISSFSYLHSSENVEDVVDEYYEEEEREEDAGVDPVADAETGADADGEAKLVEHLGADESADANAAANTNADADVATVAGAHEDGISVLAVETGDEFDSKSETEVEEANLSTATDNLDHDANGAQDAYDVSNDNTAEIEETHQQDLLTDEANEALAEFEDDFDEENDPLLSEYHEDAQTDANDSTALPAEAEKVSTHALNDDLAFDTTLGVDHNTAQLQVQQKQAQSTASSITLQGEAEAQDPGEIEDAAAAALRNAEDELDAFDDFEDKGSFDDSVPFAQSTDEIEAGSTASNREDLNATLEHADESHGSINRREQEEQNVDEGHATEYLDEGLLEKASEHGDDLFHTETDNTDAKELETATKDHGDLDTVVHESGENRSEEPIAESDELIEYPDTEEHAQVATYADEDDLGFDDDLDDALAEQPDVTTVAQSNDSALRKRSFDSHDETSEEPETKMARSR